MQNIQNPMVGGSVAGKDTWVNFICSSVCTTVHVVNLWLLKITLVVSTILNNNICFYDYSNSAQLREEISELNSKLTKALEKKAAAEAKLADLERWKLMIELDIKEIIARHKMEVTEKMAWASKVIRGGTVGCGKTL